MRGAAIAALAAFLSLPAYAQQALDLFTKPEKGNCIACHQLPPGVGPESRNDVGPRLEVERMRALGREKIRAILEDPTKEKPDSVMPPFGRHRILEKAEIDRLTDFLNALR
jgi:sulfur-oxidizing protein SoxX